MGDMRAAEELIHNPKQTIEQAGNAMKFSLKLVVAFGIIGVVTLFLLFSFISNFSTKHVGQVVKDTAFAPIDIVGARRTAQILSSTLFGGNDKSFFDINKVLTNLGEEERLTFLQNDKSISVKEFTEAQNSGSTSGMKIVIGSIKLNVPQNISESTSPETIKFIKDLEAAIKVNDLFAHEARLFRSPAAKKLYSKNKIKLFRWEKGAEDINSYSDNMKSVYEQVKDTNQTKTDLEDVDESGKKLDSVTTELLGEELLRGQKNVAIKTADIAWDKQTNEQTLKIFASKATPTEFMIASYCTAKSYVKNYDTIVTQKLSNSQRSGLKLLSSEDQEMVGKVRPKAVSSEAQQMEFFEDSRSYLQAINADVTNRRPVLNESQLAYQDPRLIKAVMQGIVDVFENPFSDGGLAKTVMKILLGYGSGGISGAIKDGIIDSALSLIDTFTPDEVIKYVVDKLYPMVCKTLTNPDSLIANVLKAMFPDVAGQVGQVAILDKTREVLIANNAYTLLYQLGLEQPSSIFSQPTEEFMKFMYRTQKTIEYAALDDGAELVSKQFQGISAFGNDLARAMGGRPTSIPEQVAFRKDKKERDYAILKNKPISYRLFSLNNQFSPVSIVAARSPKSIGGGTKRFQTQLASIFSPVNSFSGSINLAMSSAIGDKNVAHASSTNDKYDKTVQFGYSVAELKIINEDISYWPKQNREYVEQNLSGLEEKYGDCFSKPMEELLINEETNMFIETGKCTPEKLDGVTHPDALHYRVYLADKVEEESLKDLETVTQDSSSTTDTNPEIGNPSVGDIKNLAQQLLDNPNVTYPYTDTKGVNVRQVLEGVAKNGMGLVNSPDVDFNEVIVSAKMLQALVDYAKDHKIGLNALTNADHSSTSNHYKGIAIDIACTPSLDIEAFEAIVSKYGGTNNGETCPADRHWHYDFK
jgi:hypothetical protein